jgi:hypothetical protein
LKEAADEEVAPAITCLRQGRNLYLISKISLNERHFSAAVAKAAA